jgi:hypothetical protein
MEKHKPERTDKDNALTMHQDWKRPEWAKPELQLQLDLAIRFQP